MKTYNFKLGPVDTDSISFFKPSGEGFTEEEQDALIDEINSLLPEMIKYEHDGYYDTVIAIRAKNYVLYDPTAENDKDKIKTKGSALKASTKEPALKEFINNMIKIILDTKQEDVLHELCSKEYIRYVKEAADIQDIRRWVSRKTISDKILQNTRTNEAKVRDAIVDTEYKEGDRIYTYFKTDGSIGLAENFDGDYDRDKMIEKVHKTSQVFSTILPTKELFKNYKLKKNKQLLSEL